MNFNPKIIYLFIELTQLIKQNSNPSANAIKRRMEQQYSIDYDYDVQQTGVHGGGGGGGGLGSGGGSAGGGAPHSPGIRDFSARSDISIDSIERNGGLTDVTITAPSEANATAWLESLANRGAKIVQVTYPRTANNDKELTVSRGEYLEILDSTRKWWKARNIRGQMAHVPHTIVTPFNFTGSNSVSANNPNATAATIGGNANVPDTNNTNDALASKKLSRAANVS